jgi:hypothetical protein
MFAVNDRVESVFNNRIGTVILPGLVGIQFDDGEKCVIDGRGLKLAPDDEDERAFKVGDCVVVLGAVYQDLIGIVTADDGDDEEEIPYTVTFLKGQSRAISDNYIFNASELKFWFPKAGDRVTERGIDEEPGTVVSNGFGTCVVKWDNIPTPQNGWDVEELYPIIEDKTVFKVGQRVNYSSPFLRDPFTATITGVTGNTLFVKWDRWHRNYPGLLDGAYPAASFKPVETIAQAA